MTIDERDFVQYLTIKRKLAPRSVKAYRIRFSVVMRWLTENKLELDKYSLEKFLFELKEKGLSNAALNTYIQAFGHLDKFCKDRGLPNGFTEGLENLPKTHPEIIILSIEEIHKLINVKMEYKHRNCIQNFDLDKQYRTLTNFIAQTGCRFEEAASLKIKRIDVANGRATFVNTKNKDNRYAYFNGPIKEDLEYLIKDRKPDDLVFTNSKGEHVKPGDYNDDLRVRAKKAGVTKYVHAHLLRHSFATHLLMSGVDISIVATLLGHRDVRTTFETYVHLADETLRKASMRNPLLRQYVQPSEIMKTIKDTLEGFHLQDDPRFKISLLQEDNKLKIELVAV